MKLGEALNALAPGAQWTYSGNDLNTLQWLDQVIPRPSNADITAKMAQPVVPASVRMWQAKAALKAIDKLDAANTAIANSGNQAVILAWEYSPDLNRNTPSVAAIGTAIGLASADVDALFVAAAAIAV